MSTRFQSQVGPLDGERLTRAPRGYPKDHPAAHYLHFKQFLAGREYGAEFASSRTFYPELLKTFRATAPLVQFLNEALGTRRQQRAPVPDLGTRGRRQAGKAPQRPEPMWCPAPTLWRRRGRTSPRAPRWSTGPEPPHAEPPLPHSAPGSCASAIFAWSYLAWRCSLRC